MNKTIVFATGNKDKVREVKEILAGTGYEVVSMKEIGVNPDIDENGSTYTENAAIKARTVASVLPEEYKHCAVMADDSGLEIDYFDKAPGVHSARYMGEDTPYTVKNAAILKKLEGVPDELRTARFCCSIYCVFPDGRELDTYATHEGRIAYEAKGENGFGYDPIFWVPAYNMTDSELAPEVKNALSHRGKALRMMRDLLEKL